MDFKYLPSFTKAVNDRTVIGFFAIHGNVDAGSDRSHNGAFAHAMDGRNRVKHLWNHGGGMFDQGQSPPIAAIKSISEVERDGLTPEVLGYAPDATGGALVERSYLDTPRGNEVLAGIRENAITEMSYAYEVTKYDFVVENEREIRNIYAMTLFDTSDVNWGMNPATSAQKSALAAAPFADHFAAVLATVEEFVERAADLKRLRETDHRTLSGVNVERVKTLHSQIAPLQADLLSLFDRADTPQAKSTIPADMHLRAEFARLRVRILDLGVL